MKKKPLKQSLLQQVYPREMRCVILVQQLEIRTFLMAKMCHYRNLQYFYMQVGSESHTCSGQKEGLEEFP